MFQLTNPQTLRLSCSRQITTFVAIVLLVISVAPLRAEGDPSPVAQKIDALLEKSWAEKKVTPAPIADDAEFLRRTYLNLAGRIPAVSEAEEFFANESPGKRTELVNHLLEGPGYIRHFANVWKAAYLPELKTTSNFALTPELFDAWIRDHMMRNSPYDQIVRELIDASYDIVVAGLPKAKRP